MMIVYFARYDKADDSAKRLAQDDRKAEKERLRETFSELAKEWASKYDLFSHFLKKKKN
jgi:hypothetical protein